MNAARPLARRTYLIVLPVACVLMTACSGGASSAPPAAKASSTPTPTAAAAASGGTTPSPSGDCDACGQVEPVAFDIGPSAQIRPTQMDVTAGNGTTDFYNLTWSSWPSGPNGDVAASAIATATGVTNVNGSTQPATITLSDPVDGDPSLWNTLTEQIQGQQSYVVHSTGGVFAGSSSGGQTS